MKKMFGIISVFILSSVVPLYAIDVSQQWDKTYDIGGFSQAYSIQQTVDGGYVVAGSTGFDFNFLIMKLDYNGDIVWQNTYEDGIALSVQQTLDRGYIVAGWNLKGSLVLRLDSSGAIIWQKIYDDIFYVSIIQTHGGGFIMVGGVPFQRKVDRFRI